MIEQEELEGSDITPEHDETEIFEDLGQLHEIFMALECMFNGSYTVKDEEYLLVKAGYCVLKLLRIYAVDDPLYCMSCMSCMEDVRCLLLHRVLDIQKQDHE